MEQLPQALAELTPAVCAILGDADKMDPSLEEPIMDHIGSLLRMPNQRENAYKELQAASRRIGGMDSGDVFRGRYVC